MEADFLGMGLPGSQHLPQARLQVITSRETESWRACLSQPSPEGTSPHRGADETPRLQPMVVAKVTQDEGA